MAVPAYDWIGFHAGIRPQAVALIDDYTGKRHTFAQLDDRVKRMAAWLAGKGVGEGDRVAGGGWWAGRVRSRRSSSTCV